jgi:hypothetical protein
MAMPQLKLRTASSLSRNAATAPGQAARASTAHQVAHPRCESQAYAGAPSSDTGTKPNKNVPKNATWAEPAGVSAELTATADWNAEYAAIAPATNASESSATSSVLASRCGNLLCEPYRLI